MLDRLISCCRLLALLCVVVTAPGLVQAQTLWFVPPASDAGHQGFVRITNPTNAAQTVQFFGVDDAGYLAGPGSFTLGAQETKQFNSTELENGAAGKGLVGALGTGIGNWRLVFTSPGAIETTALIRVPNGFLTSVHDADPNKVQLSTFHVIPTVNPANNTLYPSVLRFVNPNPATATVRLYAYENSGQRAPSTPGSSVSFTIDALQAVHLTSAEIESGAPTKNLLTGIGPGTVKWRITVTSDIPIKVMNFIYSAGGYITELPTESMILNDANFFYCSDFEGAMVFSQDPVPVYLGFFGNATATESINNLSGPYGSAASPTSMRNAGSAYGNSLSGEFSAVNPAATKPPRALKNSRLFGAITANTAITGLSLAAIDANCTFTSTQRADQ